MNTTDELTQRIARFENMAAADPDNEMAHFSLGSAYQSAARHAEAARAFEQCIKVNPGMSKAYQLAGRAMIDAGWSDKAADVLTRGYTIAAERGDRMPRDAMGAMLEEIGRTPPKVDETRPPAAANADGKTGSFTCQRTGRPGTQLPDPPMRGPVGKWIYENISAETWREWIGQGTKVINELRLDFSKDEDQATYEQYMFEHLGIDPDIRKTSAT
ncbi:MAG: Fe(2+)-trafficking protein [Phycisphaerales bacterium]